MSIFESIVTAFNEHTECTSRCIEEVTPFIAEAAHLAAHTLLAQGKIFCAASGKNQALSQQFCQNLLQHIHYERPSLPAINLEANSSSLVSLKNEAHDNYARQLQALANSDDLLVIISTAKNDKSLKKALRCAKENQLQVIILHCGLNPRFASLITDDMVNLEIPASSKFQALSLQFLIIQILSDLIEKQLFQGLNHA